VESGKMKVGYLDNDQGVIGIN